MTLWEWWCVHLGSFHSESLSGKTFSPAWGRFSMFWYSRATAPWETAPFLWDETVLLCALHHLLFLGPTHVPRSTGMTAGAFGGPRAQALSPSRVLQAGTGCSAEWRLWPHGQASLSPGASCKGTESLWSWGMGVGCRGRPAGSRWKMGNVGGEKPSGLRLPLSAFVSTMCGVRVIIMDSTSAETLKRAFSKCSVRPLPRSPCVYSWYQILELIQCF